MPAELTQTINYTGLQQYIGEVQALLAPHRQKKKDPQKFANKIAAVVQKAYHLTRIGNEQPFMPAFAAEWISLFHNDGNLAKKFIYNPRSVFFPDKLKENFGNVPASKKTRASVGGASEVRETRDSSSSKAARAPEAATIDISSQVINKSQGISQAPPLVSSAASQSEPPLVLSSRSPLARSSAPPLVSQLAARSSAASLSSSSSGSRLGAPQSAPPLAARLSGLSSGSSSISSLETADSTGLAFQAKKSQLKKKIIKCDDEKKNIEKLLNLEINDINFRNNNEFVTLNSKISTLDTQKLNLLTELEECELNLTNVTREKLINDEKYAELFERMTDQLKTNNADYNREILELKEKNNDNLRVIEKLKIQVKNNNIDNKDLTKQLEDEEKINDFLLKELNDFEVKAYTYKESNKSIQDLYLQIINQTKEIEYIKKELSICNSNLKTCKTENNELKEQLLVCQKGVKSNNEKISTVRSSLRAAPTNPPPSSSAINQQVTHVDSPINPNYCYSNKLLTSQQRSRVKIPVNQPDFSNSPQTKRNFKVKLENETKLNTTFFYPQNKLRQRKCTPLGNNSLENEQLKNIYDFYKNEMKERNKKLVPNLKMKSVEKKTPSYQEMCEDLQKLTKQQDDKCKREFIKKVQDAQSSATTAS